MTYTPANTVLLLLILRTNEGQRPNSQRRNNKTETEEKETAANLVHVLSFSQRVQS